ncbi:DUF2637 domain-containing protein [Nonomuraea endophytica]|uniref:DUF2637 domain-containing protein n=1 Tax=Nonomuraea endophytica TaxID=714136 RepID=A0A7W8A6T8_9ACTN|nr:DUF2637 domain-containing protein [Nonomuraea endophytica]MBB5080686.1 hypothetical protein [Nonomuraea endophytica]
MRRFACWLLDSGPVLVLAVIAGAGSFTHIRDTAADHGQTGWMSWAIAVCIDLTCVMAARERQRDKKTGRLRRGLISWPVLVLSGGVVLSLAANLAQAVPTVWGWITAATPAGALLVAVSMLERRAASPRPEPCPAPVPALEADEDTTPVETEDGPAPALLDYARRVADEHHAKHGKPITRDALRVRLGISDQLASTLIQAF